MQPRSDKRSRFEFESLRGLLDTDRLKDLQDLQQKVTEEVQRLREQAMKLAPVQELKSVFRHPRALGARIEEASPWLNRRFLGVASNWIEPFLAGMGLKVERLTEDHSEVIMPGSWRNQGESGVVHSAALCALGEFTSRIFWEHHLDLRLSDFEVRGIELKLLCRPVGQMRSIYRLAEMERESALQRLREAGAVEIESLALIYDEQGRLVAETNVQWKISRVLALGSGQSDSVNDHEGQNQGTDSSHS
jgi:acyl-coenzyme A thioesterase PaaI-like protein